MNTITIPITQKDTVLIGEIDVHTQLKYIMVNTVIKAISDLSLDKLPGGLKEIFKNYIFKLDFKD